MLSNSWKTVQNILESKMLLNDQDIMEYNTKKFTEKSSQKTNTSKYLVNILLSKRLKHPDIEPNSMVFRGCFAEL